MRALCFSLLFAVVGVSYSQGQSPTPQKSVSDYDSLYEQAQIAISVGDRDRAVGLLEQVIKLNPRSAGALLDLALLHCELGESKEALERFIELERRFELPESIQSLITFRRQLGCANSVDVQYQAQITTGRVSNVNAAPISPIVQIGSGARTTFLELTERNRPTSDRFMGFGLQATGPVNFNNVGRWIALLDSRRYDTRNDFDLTNLVLGYAHPADINFGIFNHLNSMVSYGRVFLGERRFESALRFGADAWTLSHQAFSNSVTRARFGLGALLSVNRYDQDIRFDGHRLELLIRGEAILGSRFLFTSYVGPVLDQAVRDRPGGDRSGAVLGVEASYISPFGRTVVGFHGQQLQDQAVFNEIFFPEIERRNRRFFSTLRHEILVPDLGLGVSRLVVFGQVAKERSIDRLSIFSFKNHTLMAGIRGFW